MQSHLSAVELERHQRGAGHNVCPTAARTVQQCLRQCLHPTANRQVLTMGDAGDLPDPRGSGHVLH